MTGPAIAATLFVASVLGLVWAIPAAISAACQDDDLFEPASPDGDIRCADVMATPVHGEQQ